MGTTSMQHRSVRRRAGALVAAMAVAVVALAPHPAEAAGLSLPVQMGQRFLNSPSPAKAVPLPLATDIGPIRPLAVAGVNATTFQPIKDPLLGTTLLSGSQVKQLVLDTLANLDDRDRLAFKVNALEHPNPTEFALGGNCIGADGTTTAACVMTITFTPKTPGAKSDPISAQITITQGMQQVEDALRSALQNQGVLGFVLNLAYPLIRSNIQNTLTDGIEDALLRPFAVASGTGVAGPFTDPAVFVRRQYADFGAATPSATQVNNWVGTFEGGGAPSSLIDALRKAPAWDGKVGPLTRLYSAYFLRPPDTSGLRFWVGKLRAGTKLRQVSSTFAASSEFQRRYGELSNAAFVDLVYRNVLNRPPDAAGLAYWTARLDAGRTRGEVMLDFSESSEYVRKQGPAVIVVELWFAMLRRAPSAAEITSVGDRLRAGTAVSTIINEVLASAEYKAVVTG